MFGEGDARGRSSDAGAGHAWCVTGRVVAAPFELIDDLDFDCGFRAGVNAGGLESSGETAMAHVALTDDAALGVELGNRVGAVPDTVLAADAGVGRVEDDAGHGVFGVGVNGAALDAVGGQAMVAAHGEVKAVGVGIGAAFDLSDAPPAEMGGCVVLVVYGHAGRAEA